MQKPALLHKRGLVQKRIAIVFCLAVLGLSLGGCTKCGFLWDDLGRACKAELPK